MEIQEALNFVNRHMDNEFIKTYFDALNAISNFELENQDEFEFYKSSSIYDYFIELPKQRIEYNFKEYKISKTGYSFIGTSKTGTGSVNYCLSYCGRSKEDVIKMIEANIIKDNTEVERAEP